LDVAGYFDLDACKASAIAGEVGKAVSRWSDEASRQGLSKNEIDRMRQLLNMRICIRQARRNDVGVRLDYASDLFRGQTPVRAES